MLFGHTCIFLFISVVSSYDTAVSFDGDGFVEIEAPLQRYSTQEVILIVNTRVSDGILYWRGQDPTVSGLGRDFVAIALVNGKVQFRYNKP